MAIESFKPLGINTSKCDTVLRKERGPLTQGQIADRSGVPYQTVVSAVKTLIERGLATEFRKVNDKARYYVSTEVEIESNEGQTLTGTSKVYYFPTHRDMYVEEIIEDNSKKGELTTHLIECMRKMLSIANQDEPSQENLNEVKKRVEFARSELMDMKKFIDSLNDNKRFWKIETLAEALLTEKDEKGFEWKHLTDVDDFRMNRIEWIRGLFKCVDNQFLTWDQIQAVFPEMNWSNHDMLKDSSDYVVPAPVLPGWGLGNDHWTHSKKNREDVYKVNYGPRRHGAKAPEKEVTHWEQERIDYRAKLIKESGQVQRILGMRVSDLVE